MLLNQTALTAEQAHDLSRLINACRLYEPVTLGLPADGDQYLLIDSAGHEAESPSLLACLAICRVQEDLWECYAFTHPRFRRQGYFSRLLEELCSIAQEQEELLGIEIDLVFLSDGKSPDGLAAAKALELTLWYSEHQMELNLAQWNRRGQMAHASSSPLRLQRQLLHEADAGTDAWLYHAFLCNPPHDPARTEAGEVCPGPIGTCRLIPYDASRFYLYHVNIQEKLRSRGWGTRLLSAVLQELPPNASVILQVSSSNEPALRLYKKAGFRITETLSYYLY